MAINFKNKDNNVGHVNVELGNPRTYPYAENTKYTRTIIQPEQDLGCSIVFRNIYICVRVHTH